jgi:phenylalanyl-tRNA synthetase alpha chain
MSDDLHSLQARFDSELAACAAPETLDALESAWLGKKGPIADLFKRMGGLAPEERKAFGAGINTLKAQATQALASRRAALLLEAQRRELEDPGFDPTLPGTPGRRGTFHPLDLVRGRLEDIFRAMGFHVLDYPELESEFCNFEALNIPADHPARDMQDTFWLEPQQPTDRLLLRTHTSAGQVRAMREIAPPFRAIFPGRVFRMEAVDASHEHTFHQVEGLMIDRDLSVANLISSMKTLLSSVFERDVTVRLRPGYFPFVEPGFELDIKCMVCGGSGCSVCKQSGWLELLPCGLVHPNVLRAGGLDPNEWTGWAFGLGLSRLVMMKYQLDDIRLLLGGDLRFLEQFADA